MEELAWDHQEAGHQNLQIQPHNLDQSNSDHANDLIINALKIQKISLRLSRSLICADGTFEVAVVLIGK